MLINAAYKKKIFAIFLTNIISRSCFISTSPTFLASDLGENSCFRFCWQSLTLRNLLPAAIGLQVEQPALILFYRCKIKPGIEKPSTSGSCQTFMKIEFFCSCEASLMLLERKIPFSSFDTRLKFEPSYFSKKPTHGWEIQFKMKIFRGFYWRWLAKFADCDATGSMPAVSGRN